MERVRSFMLKEAFGIVALVGALVLSVYMGRLPRFDGADFEFLLVMTALLMVVDSLERQGISLLPLTLAVRVPQRLRPAVPLMVTFLASSVFTNDGALVMLLPAALRWYGTERAFVWLPLMGIAANGGAMLTPAGAPQNLLIAWRFSVHYPAFIRVMAVPALAVLAVLVLLAVVLVGSNPSTSESSDSGRPIWRSPAPLCLGLLFGVMLRFLPVWVAVLPMAWCLFREPRSLLRVDWALLGTFLAFFAFTDLLVDFAHNYLKLLGNHVMWSTLGLSQVVGNVPATLLLIDVTHDWKGLLLGSAIGGFGTLWASMVGVIVYRYWRRVSHSDTRSFLVWYHLLSFGVLVLLALLAVSQ